MRRILVCLFLSAGMLCGSMHQAICCKASVIEQENVKKNDVICNENTDWDRLVIASDEQMYFLYSENHTGSDVVAQLAPGAAAEIIGEDGNWYFARSGIYRGFLKKDSGLLTGKTAERYAFRQLDKQAQITSGTVFVHGYQKSRGRMPYIVGVLGRDQVIRLGRQTKEGYLVSISGVTGIVDKQDVYASVVLNGATEPDIHEVTNLSDDSLGTYEDELTYNVSQNLVPDSEGMDFAEDGGSAFTSIVNYAMLFLGNPYVWGGESLTDGVDCSGFIMKLYEHYGISLPHSSFLLRSCGEMVSEGYFDEERSLPGDIVCYEGHVALYMGDGKIIHAANRRDGIKISEVDYRNDIVCVRRICVGHGIWGNVSDEEFSALCRIVETEAGACSLQEKIYVADVVLNRVCSSRFSNNTIVGIITDPGQFQPVTNGRWQSAVPSADSIFAARYALQHNDSSMGALFFLNPKLSDPDNVAWFKHSLKFLFMIDETAFFK